MEFDVDTSYLYLILGDLGHKAHRNHWGMARPKMAISAPLLLSYAWGNPHGQLLAPSWT